MLFTSGADSQTDDLVIPTVDQQGQPLFDERQMRSCAQYETCVQCGLCCFAFKVDIPRRPITAINDRVSIVRKAAGELCPYAGFDTEGKAICSCHEFKGNRAMEVCADFNGGDPLEAFEDDGYEARRSRYFDLVQATFAVILDDPSPVKISRVTSFCQRGSIQMPFSINHIRGRNKLGRLIRLFQSILSLDYLNTEILDRIEDLNICLQMELKGKGVTLLCALNLNPDSNQVHRAFIERYVSSLPTFVTPPAVSCDSDRGPLDAPALGV